MGGENEGENGDEFVNSIVELVVWARQQFSCVLLNEKGEGLLDGRLVWGQTVNDSLLVIQIESE